MSLVQSLERVPARVEARPSRYAYADNLKVLLVVGVIVGHATMAWVDNDAWVLDEPPVHEPLMSTLNLMALVGVLFAMPLFFVIAGQFTPRSLARKGPRRYIVDRVLRLGVPLVFYQLAFAPIVEYVDVQNNAGWDGGFLRFVWHTWQHPAPGPLWFLWVLLVFSISYVAVRAAVPARAHVPGPPPARSLVALGVFIAIASYLIRIPVQFGQEVLNDFFLAQSPGWVAGFTLGILSAERGWIDRISPAMSRVLSRVAWAAVGAVAVVASVTMGALGWDVEDLLAGGTWASAVIAMLQGTLVVAMSLWLLDVFRRRLNRQGPLLREMSRGAFGAYVVHQVVLVGTVLATRHVGWPPEVEWTAAATLAVVGSFGVGALLIRVPGISRIV